MKQIENYNYYIDEIGNVYNSKGLKLKPFLSNKGYYMYKLFIDGNTKRKWIYPHRYIAINYIPNPDNKPQVNHINGDKTDNRIENLEWVTGSENQQHRVKVLKKGIGENHSNTKLTEEQVKWIREHYIHKHKEFGLTPLSKKFNIGVPQILRIINYERWKHI